MKVNILQFENATMQALHEKAATAANAAVVYGPFVGGWWEQYLAAVIAEAQAEQRIADANDIAQVSATLMEVRECYAVVAKELAAVTKERDAMKNALKREQELRGAAEIERNDLLNARHVDAEALHDTAIEDEAGNACASAITTPSTTEDSSSGAALQKSLPDNPATYTARPNPFSK